mmetsp:Transcript_20482/g.51760  ORF Transcript_20482/g.51760 Transcript_20482/m.51760 type:complete len:219 (-) Transcript_20482:185-841(-)|eukprot:CAMPEP_0178992436 /NCGR_PEP_ID=MMETSP0795-20121207/6113_1 /TAXON_ID=88552 /ORGANISM="Amoebophrya sp., Strain Ameob2" /LENGTH=218 /DNA_ID=CAMNT_0020684317 /DNA_START=258 /DNA_END=914 /DNA_ORIENTATION=+
MSETEAALKDSSPTKDVAAPVAELPPEDPSDIEAPAPAAPAPAADVPADEVAGAILAPISSTEGMDEGEEAAEPGREQGSQETGVGAADSEAEQEPRPPPPKSQLPLTPGLIASRRPVTLKQASFPEQPEVVTDEQEENAEYVKKHLLEERTAWMTNPVLHARPEDFHPYAYMICYLLGTLSEEDRQRNCEELGIKYGTYAGRFSADGTYAAGSGSES